MRDLGLMGEAAFSLWCNSVGLIANGSQIDKTGWDFFVEFPVKQNDSLPVDMLPAPIECKVQVKATDKRKRRVQISVSNLNRLVKAQMPAFICIIQFDGNNEPQEAYLVHVGKEIIENTLKRMRELDVEGDSSKLHKHEIGINYGIKDRLTKANGESLKERIESYIAHGIEKYITTKNESIKTVGFEKGSGSFKVTVKSDDPIKDVVDLTLGLRTDLNIEKFIGWRSRFGIVSKNPLVEGGAGIISISNLKPSTKAKIIFKESALSPGISFNTDIYFSQMSRFVPKEYIKVRAKSKLIELIIEPHNNKTNITFSYDSKTDSTLGELRDALKLQSLLKKNSGMILEIKPECYPPLDARIGSSEGIDDWSGLYTIADGAVAICHKLNVPEENIIVSVDDLIENSASIENLYNALYTLPASAKLEFTVRDRDLRTNERTVCVFFFKCTIGDHILGCYVGMKGYLELLEKDRYKLNCNEIIYDSPLLVKKVFGIEDTVIVGGFEKFEATLRSEALVTLRLFSQ